jgi:hypothetical protein
VTIDGGTESLVRNPDSAFVELASRTQGMSVRGGVGERDPNAAEMLVRPITLDDVTVTSHGWKSLAELDRCNLDGENGLPEGTSCEWWFEGTHLSGPIVVEGKLWGQRVTRVLKPDPTRGLAMAREVAARKPSFEEGILKSIDDAAKSVNNGWSLVGTWGGTGGYGPEGGGSGSFGMASCCIGGSIGDVGVGTGGFGTVGHLDVSMQLRNALRACRAEKLKVDVTLELTLEEIVGVKVSGAKDLDSCIEEAIWNVPLAIDHPPIHSTSEFSLGPL